jgi:hypothetical protein
VTCRVEKGVVFLEAPFADLPGGRSQWRLPQSRNHGLQGSTHYGYCVHGIHLLPIDHDRRHCGTPTEAIAYRVIRAGAPTEHRPERNSAIYPKQRYRLGGLSVPTGATRQLRQFEVLTIYLT